MSGIVSPRGGYVSFKERHGAFEPYRPGPSEPTYTLDRQIAHARKSMGEARWRELNDEFLSERGDPADG